MQIFIYVWFDFYIWLMFLYFWVALLVSITLKSYDCTLKKLGQKLQVPNASQKTLCSSKLELKIYSASCKFRLRLQVKKSGCKIQNSKRNEKCCKFDQN